MLSASHIVVEDFWTTLLYNGASVHWGLPSFVYVQLSWGPNTEFQSGWGLYFDLVILTPWIPPWLLFQSFCFRFAAVLGIIAMLHDPILPKALLSDNWLTSDSMTARCPGPMAAKQAPIHHASTTVPDSWCEVFVLIYCIWFSANVMLCIMTKHLHFCLVCLKDIVWQDFWIV